MKRLLADWLGRPPLARLARRFLRGRATIFMLHRFADPDRGAHGIAPELVTGLLAHLRRERIPIRSLVDLLDRWTNEPQSLDGDVAFTVDDGYADFASTGAPAFAQFDVPATVFLVTGFLDRASWLWWDRIAWIAISSQGTVSAPVDRGPPLVIAGDRKAERLVAAQRISGRLKEVPDPIREAAIDSLAKAAAVTVPSGAPAGFEPMTWEQVRRLAAAGFGFGAHTVRHPILSRSEPDQARAEIVDSWNRLRSELPTAVPVFCYPNGTLQDFGDREERIVEATGLTAALSTIPGYLTGGAGRFRLPRFAFPPTLGGAVQIAFGVERAKAIVRGEA